jgi:hypothetical protein
MMGCVILQKYINTMGDTKVTPANIEVIYVDIKRDG